MNKLILGFALAMSMPVLAQAAEYKVEMKFNEDSGDVYFEPKKTGSKIW